MLPRVILQSSTCREMECFFVKEQAYLAYSVKTGDRTDTMIPLLCECRLPSESLHVTLGGHWALGSLSGCPWLFVMPFINYVNKELPVSSQHLWNIGSPGRVVRSFRPWYYPSQLLQDDGEVTRSDVTVSGSSPKEIHSFTIKYGIAIDLFWKWLLLGSEHSFLFLVEFLSGLVLNFVQCFSLFPEVDVFIMISSLVFHEELYLFICGY